MKKNILILVSLVFSIKVYSQAPEKLSYQGVIRDINNTLVTGQTIQMQISLLRGSVTGTSVYTEKQTSTTNENGLISIEIGTGTVLSGAFNTIDWSNGPYFIKTETDPTGGSDFTITGTSQLLSVPYALHAKTAENIRNDQVDDADADPSNEIQVVTFSNDTLYLSNGGQVYLGAYASDLVDDADADPSNEIQVVTFSNDTLYLSNGGQVYLGAYASDLVDDADADPSNEIQTLSISDENISLSLGGGSVQLPIQVPRGSIMMWSVQSPPDGWLICDGSAVSRATFSDLFSVIGTTFGAGDGSTTFNLPNMQGRVPIGFSNEFLLASTGGNPSAVANVEINGTVLPHQLTIDEMPNHNHTNGAYDQLLTINGDATVEGIDSSLGEPNVGSSRPMISTGGNQAHTHGFQGGTATTSSISLYQPYLTLNYIIKY